MTHPSHNGVGKTIDHEASFARIRAELADLDAAIDDLRSEADRLLETASGRVTVATVAAAQSAAEPPTSSLTGTADDAGVDAASTPNGSDDARVVVDDPASTENAPEIPAFGMVPAVVPAVVDPEPVVQGGVEPVFGGDVQVEAGVEPVFGGDAPMEPVVQGGVEPVFGGDVQVEAGVEPVFGGDAPVEAVQAGVDPAAVRGGATGGGQEPALGMGDVDPGAADATSGEALESAVGGVGTEATEVVEAVPAPMEAPVTDRGQLAPVEERRPEPSAVVVDETVRGGDAQATAMDPVDWGDGAPVADDGAFERFFSDDVEPEPSQRWLLDS